MKKIFAISTILLVALLLVVSFSLAFAGTGAQFSSQVTPVPGGPGWMWENEEGAYSHGPGMMWGDEDGEYSHGPGMMWGDKDGEYSHGPGMMWDNDGQFFGRHGGMWGNQGADQDNPMHDVMTESLAEAAGMTVDDFNARLTEGDTMFQILESAGLSAEEITEAYNNAHDASLQAAVDEGWMTQEQADWMDERMQGMWDGENSAHHGACGGYNPGSNL